MGWLRQHAVLVTTTGLLLISLTLLMVNTRGQRRVDPLGVVFLEVVTPVANLSGAMTSRLSHAWSSYVDLVGVREEREWLRQRVRDLEREVDSSLQLRQENERLNTLLDLREALGGMPIAARVTGISASPLFHTATLGQVRLYDFQKQLLVRGFRARVRASIQLNARTQIHNTCIHEDKNTYISTWTYR